MIYLLFDFSAAKVSCLGKMTKINYCIRNDILYIVLCLEYCAVNSTYENSWRIFLLHGKNQEKQKLHPGVFCVCRFPDFV